LDSATYVWRGLGRFWVI